MIKFIKKNWVAINVTLIYIILIVSAILVLLNIMSWMLLAIFDVVILIYFWAYMYRKLLNIYDK